ncbi:MAG: polyhydroxyalkanoate synthesis repressor PhaR [Gammaproteobacteria bacterium]|nr:polyhydroxyalkanoate synthesis repressor PhaR [Gammaproteobacteria bacterium]
MAEIRIIKKYPNRRLYDTEVSSYITLDDVRKLVMEQVEFCVIDARSKEDITRSILLQIILEQEEGGEPIFTQEVLSQLIRFYGDTLQGSLASFLEQSCNFFVQQQNKMRDQVESMMTGDPLVFMREATEKNVALWQEMQQSFLRAATGATRPTQKDED